MLTIWTSHLKTKAERDAFEKLLKNTDKRVLDEIEKHIRKNLERAENDAIDLSNYDSPSWAYRQAHMNGFKEGTILALELILDLKGERY